MFTLEKYIMYGLVFTFRALLNTTIHYTLNYIDMNGSVVSVVHVHI